MVHLFTVNGDYLAFDTESQSLHFVDLPAWQVIRSYQENKGKRPPEAELGRLARHWGEAVYDCAAQVDQLIEQNSLFVRSQPIPLSALYPDGPQIKSMCLHLCHDCNMRCEYCFASTGDFGTGHRSLLDLATGKRAVDFLIAAAGDRHNLDIDFFGGEPLLNWPVVVDLTHYCEKRARESGKNIRLTITTNALTLKQEQMEFINRHFKNCVLSIDGRAEVHNRMRPDAAGRDTYERIAGNIREFVKLRQDREYYLRGTYTAHNLDFDRDVLHLAELGHNVSIEPVVAPEGCDYKIKESDLPQIEAAYERLAKEMWEREKAAAGFLFFHFMINLAQGPCLYKRVKGCGAGTEYCAVTPQGDIYPCHQFVGIEKFKLGNVFEPQKFKTSLKEHFAQYLVPQKETCLNCWARYFCGGGCLANAWFATGSLDGIYELGCRLEKKRLECGLWLEAKRLLSAAQAAK